jgi:hypothetical protein
VSNIALFSGSAVPAFAKKAELSAIAKALAGGAGGGGGKRISIKGGVFRLMVDGKEVAAIDERFLDVVIVNAAPKIGRTFYLKAYDSETPSGPDCWSADGEKPDPSSANIQATNCASCPQNVKGSGQGESRACRYSQRLAVVLASDVEGDVMQLQLPATSIFGKEEGENRPLQAYARYLAAQSVSPETLVTRMKFDTKSEAPKLHFKPMRWLTEEEYATAVEQGQSEEAKRAVTMTVAQTDKVEPLKLEGSSPAKAPAKAKAAPPPAEDDDEPPAPPPKATPKKKAAAKAEPEAEAEPDVEPTVRKEAKPAPAEKSSLAKLAQAWDDED